MADSTHSFLSGQTPSYWRTLTDEALLRVSFTTDSPEELPGVTFDPPPPGAAHIEQIYDVRGRPKGLARCSHCRRTNHFVGAVVIHEDGSRRLVGWKCASDLYGADFENLKGDFKAARDRQSYLQTKQRALSAKDILFDGVVRLANHPACQQFSAMRRDLMSVFPDHLYRRLLGATELTITERVRDYAAEERRQEQWDEAGLGKMAPLDRKKWRRKHGLQGGEIYKEVPRSLGPIEGTEILSIATSPAAILQDVVKDLYNLFSSLDDADLKTKELAGANKRLHELLDLIEMQVRRLRAPILFFGNVMALAEWANAQGEYGTAVYYVEGQRIARQDNRTTHHAGLPLEYNPPTGDFIRRVRQALKA